ncbi:hypothetical protein [Blastococcus mobilis]|uniref:Uncharacterized protein n=1 Tax=Blastococcus mobilis TaxID=1938746 RepID=A0A238VMV8_9ACTN|nr:hypothetical protein [Blastococcus mobilis]SNR35695.1 hypothetical protein SAMN06272737_1044 [Blastococcus mobilis]
MTRPSLLSDTWYARDLPILVEVVRRFDGEPNGRVGMWEVADASGLSEDDVIRAAHALANPGLVTTSGTMAKSMESFRGVSTEARRHAGLWPSPEAVADRLVAALQAAADNASEGEPRTRARRALDAFVAAGRDFAVDVAAGVTTKQLGG